jgi:hypothetical protein
MLKFSWLPIAGSVRPLCEPAGAATPRNLCGLLNDGAQLAPDRRLHWLDVALGMATAVIDDQVPAADLATRCWRAEVGAESTLISPIPASAGAMQALPSADFVAALRDWADFLRKGQEARDR